MVEFKSIETKWKKKWKDSKISEVEPNEKPKFFLIWAYPNVSGFHHVGHMRGYSYTDIISRFKRLKGFNVLLTAGGHASGNNGYAKSLKVKNKDPDTVNYYREMGLSDKDLEYISTPEGFVDFFKNKYMQDYEDFGFFIDNRRFTVTINEDYNKFIKWQFKKLKQKDMLVQKPYYATWSKESGAVAVDPSESDLSKGGNAQKNEYTLIKYKFEDSYLVAATLRPETIFGQTNLWIKKDTDYVKINVDGEKYIASEEFAKKIVYQKENVEVLEKIKYKDLMGKFAFAPGIEKEIPILPCDFLETSVGSGIVTSVPSDAPVDFVALKDLTREKCIELGLDYGIIESIDVIPIIKSKDFGLIPAKEIVKKLNISNQLDEKLEEAKKLIYKKGFHTGEMLDNAKEFAGLKVEQAKQKIKEKLIVEKKADIFYDLSEEVICRNGGEVFVKKVDNQWFIKYSDEEVTKLSKEHSKDMKLYPNELKNNFPKILEWFEDRACARQGNWLGTKLPFDESYTIEPIADSTLYPIFYLISKYTNSGEIKTEDLTEEFFDFVFLGKDTKHNVSKEVANKIRKDVEYWYPLDLNIGGKEHQTVHFPVFLMNHVKILPKSMWPKGIFVNWWVVGKGGKISKSKGGAKSIQDEAKIYGVDSMRLFYANAASPFVDVEFDPEKIKIYKQRIEKIYEFVSDFKFEEKTQSQIDKWIKSRFSKIQRRVFESLDEFEFRTATDDIYFNFYKDLVWYKTRGGNNKEVISNIFKEWFKLMSPFTPFVAEELNSKFSKDMIALQEFEKFEFGDKEIEILEEIIVNTNLDIKKVLELAKLEKLKEIKIIISNKWKFDFYNELESKIKTEDPKSLIPYFMQKYKDKEAMKVIQKARQMNLYCTSQEDEINALNNAKNLFEKEYKAKVIIEKAENSKESKAKSASPNKPAITLK
ncbi:MAG: leucine--tRNA ligase [Candidatus Woesearchaeota archaeon]